MDDKPASSHSHLADRVHRTCHGVGLHRRGIYDPWNAESPASTPETHRAIPPHRASRFSPLRCGVMLVHYSRSAPGCHGQMGAAERIYMMGGGERVFQLVLQAGGCGRGSDLREWGVRFKRGVCQAGLTSLKSGILLNCTSLKSWPPL